MKIAVAGGSIWVSPCIKNVREASSRETGYNPHNDAYDQRTTSNGGQRSYNRHVVCDGHICADAQEYQRAAEIPNPTKAAAGK